MSTITTIRKLNGDLLYRRLSPNTMGIDIKRMLNIDDGHGLCYDSLEEIGDTDIIERNRVINVVLGKRKNVRRVLVSMKEKHMCADILAIALDAGDSVEKLREFVGEHHKVPANYVKVYANCREMAGDEQILANCRLGYRVVPCYSCEIL